MTPFDYITDILLIAVVIRQMRIRGADPAFPPPPARVFGWGRDHLPAPHLPGWQQRLPDRRSRRNWNSLWDPQRRCHHGLASR